MVAAIMGLKRRAGGILGLDYMNGKFNVLALNYVFLMMYYTLESVFVNTLLYRISPEMEIVIQYRIVMYLFTALSMNLAAYISKRSSPILVIRLGGVAYIIMYLILFFGMDHMQQLRYVVAFFSGTGCGFYFSSHTVLITAYTSRGNRGMGVAIMGLIQGSMTLLVPVISGTVISLMPGSAGYRVMFGICIAAVLMQARVQRSLAPVEQPKHTSEMGLALRLLWNKSTVKMMMGAEFIRGFRDGTFTFFLNMLLFRLITDEFMVGINTFLTGIMAIFGSWAYGRLAIPGRRVKLMTVFTTVLFVMGAGLFLFQTATYVIFFAFFNAFLSLFIIYTVNTYSYDVMAQNKTMRRCMAEMSALREIAIEGGRIAGLLVVMLFPDTIEGAVLAMCILTVTQYGAAILTKWIKATLDRKDIKRQSVQFGPETGAGGERMSTACRLPQNRRMLHRHRRAGGLVR